MKNIIKIFTAFSLICLLAACDSRDDYFLEHCDEPVINLYSDKDTTIDGKKYIIVDISWGETKNINFDFLDEYGEVSGFSYETDAIFCGRDDDYYWIKAPTKITILEDNGWMIEDVDNPILGNHLQIQINNETKQIQISETTSSLEEYYKDHQIYYGGNGKRTLELALRFTIKNILGKEGFANIFLNVYKNRAPEPTIIVEDITGNSMAKKISVIANDPEDEEIIAYEYCIDGSVIKSYGYEIELPIKLNPTIVYPPTAAYAGEAAYNGTYITSTSLSSINHVFQTEGTHTIYVRCKDKWECWSHWTNLEITIKK